MSNRLTNGAFCALPFISAFQNLNGSQYLCCHSDIPIDSTASDATNELRKKIWNGEKIPHCTKCYDLEEKKSHSERSRATTFLMKDPEINEYLTTWTPDTPNKIYYYDIRFDNKCNLACITCEPKASSLWSKELGIELPKYESKFNLDDCVKAKKIYLAGGEPLIIDQYIDLIKKISKLENQPELVINTNLTRVSESLKPLLSKIKNLTLTVSVDSFGKVNEYHRWPMKWSKFVNNLNWVRDNLQCTVQFNTVVDAVSISNIHRLVEIEQLTDHWNLSILVGPEALVVNNLPEHMKPLVSSNFEKIKQSRFYSQDVIFKTRVDTILTQINSPGNDFLLSNYIKQIDQRRNLNHENYLGVKLT
jgi:organic radical activating enzyme